MSTTIADKLKAALKLVKISELGFRFGNCPSCGRTLFARLNYSDWGVRCVRCGAAPNTMSIVAAIRQYVPELERASTYVISKSGPLFEFLKQNSGEHTCSHFDDSIEPGEYSDGIQCQDVERLTYADESFDLCVHSEVFEHVPHYRRGYCEIFRVLKPGGYCIFTIPVFDREYTIERATIKDGELVHFLPESYHNDQFRGSVLVFRDYGRDCVERMKQAGFNVREVISGANPTGLWFDRPDFDRPVYVVQKPPV